MSLSPRFRPPLRYLIALEALEARYDTAEQAVRVLRTLESGFTVDQMLDDRDYPVAAMRKSELAMADPVRRLRRREI